MKGEGRAHRPVRRHRLHGRAHRSGAGRARCAPCARGSLGRSPGAARRRAGRGLRRGSPTSRGARARESGDVLISTVGPFARWGEAAINAGATYFDSTGEPAFIRRVFDHHGPRAAAAGSALLTASRLRGDEVRASPIRRRDVIDQLMPRERDGEPLRPSKRGARVWRTWSCASPAER